PAAYLDGATDGVPNRRAILDDMVMVWLTNRNPAASPFAELFDDATLAQVTAYRPVVASLEEFFAAQPPFGPDDQNLIEFLRSPAVAVPHSLTGQLGYIMEKWGYLLGTLLYRLLSGLDLLREEERARQLRFAGPGVFGADRKTAAPSFTGQEVEAE